MDVVTSLLFATAEVVTESSGDIDWFDLIVGLLGGLALFLLGMDRMTESLRVVAGDRLRRILEKLTSNRITGCSPAPGSPRSSSRPRSPRCWWLGSSRPG